MKNSFHFAKTMLSIIHLNIHDICWAHASVFLFSADPNNLPSMFQIICNTENWSHLVYCNINPNVPWCPTITWWIIGNSNCDRIQMPYTRTIYPSPPPPSLPPSKRAHLLSPLPNLPFADLNGPQCILLNTPPSVHLQNNSRQILVILPTAPHKSSSIQSCPSILFSLSLDFDSKNEYEKKKKNRHRHRACMHACWTKSVRKCMGNGGALPVDFIPE